MAKMPLESDAILKARADELLRELTQIRATRKKLASKERADRKRKTALARSRLAKRIAALFETGLTYEQIGENLGITANKAKAWDIGRRCRAPFPKSIEIEPDQALSKLLPRAYLLPECWDAGLHFCALCEAQSPAGFCVVCGDQITDEMRFAVKWNEMLGRHPMTGLVRRLGSLLNLLS